MLFYVNGKGLVFVIFFHSHIRVHCLFNIGDQTWDLCIQGGENLIEGFQPSMSMSQPHGAKRVFWQGAQFTPCNLTLIWFWVGVFLSPDVTNVGISLSLSLWRQKFEKLLSVGAQVSGGVIHLTVPITSRHLRKGGYSSNKWFQSRTASCRTGQRLFRMWSPPLWSWAIFSRSWPPWSPSKGKSSAGTLIPPLQLIGPQRMSSSMWGYGG